MEDIPPEELNSRLAHFFFIKVRKLNGNKFEPGTSTSLQPSLDRYLRQNGKNYNIQFNSIQFYLTYTKYYVHKARLIL